MDSTTLTPIALRVPRTFNSIEWILTLVDFDEKLRKLISAFNSIEWILDKIDEITGLHIFKSFNSIEWIPSKRVV